MSRVLETGMRDIVLVSTNLLDNPFIIRMPTNGQFVGIDGYLCL